MLALVEHLAKSLVDQPDAVKVTQVDNGKEITIHLTVAQEDMGKVIGKQGKIAKALRTIVRAATPASSKKYAIEICEKNGTVVDGDVSEN